MLIRFCGSRLLFLGAFFVASAAAYEPAIPKMLAYSATPNDYFNDHAADVAQLYDGFYFVAGSWDAGIVDNLGLDTGTPPKTPWKNKVRVNLENLRKAGVTESLLGVHFSDSEPWPSAETLLSDEYTKKMALHFGALGRSAKELGFRGVSIDVEYPYPRYEPDHPVYTYQGYTAEDLLEAAHKQGRAVMSALLDAYADAVVFMLPGVLNCRPLCREFELAMLDVMAERDAAGGMHLGFERAYCLLDPVSQVALTRNGELEAAALIHDPNVKDYWRRRCSVAPGVWPLHMVETGGKDYPKRPWSEELMELRQQMEILRGCAKQFIWSFSGQPVWLPVDAMLETKYALPARTFEGADEVVRGWRAILRDKAITQDPHLTKLIGSVTAYDRGEIDEAMFCSRMGAPAEYYILGPLTNPFMNAAYSAPGAIKQPISLEAPVHGRDGVARWFRFRNYEPTGSIRITAAFDWSTTDKSSVHLVAAVHAERPTEAILWANWDDGAEFYLNNQLVLDHRSYPERGHGLLYKDRYDFEDKTAVSLRVGENIFGITSINSHGSWGVNVRFTDKDGWPLDGVTFSLPETCDSK